MNNFKIYRTLADIGISSATTTLQDVFTAFYNIGGNSIFIYSQGTLSSGITDLPIGYGQLKMIISQGRVSAWYTTGNYSYYLCDNQNITTRTADDLIPIPLVVNNLTSSTYSKQDSLSAYQGYVLNDNINRLINQYRVMYLENQNNKFLIIQFVTTYGYVSLLYSCPYFSGLISVRTTSLSTTISQTAGISHMQFDSKRTSDISGMSIQYVAAWRINDNNTYRIKIAFSDNIPASCYILLGNTTSSTIYSQDS